MTKTYKSSLFCHKGVPTTTQHADLAEVHRIVVTGIHLVSNDLATLTKLVLAETDSTKQSALKDKLPFYCGSVQYTPAAVSKKATEPFHHTGQVHLDYDHLPPNELTRLTAAFKADPFTAFLFTSSRGSGLKQFVYVDGITTANHEDVYYALRMYAKAKHNAVADELCTPVTKGCYLRHDPAAYLNDHPASFTADQLLSTYPAPKRSKPKASKGTATGNDLARNVEVVEDLVQQVQANNVVLAENYGDWTNLGFALKNTFGDQGFAYWNAFSAVDSAKYQGEESTRYKWDHDLTGSAINPVTFGTVMHLAKEVGLTPIKPSTPPTKKTSGGPSVDDVMNEWLKDYSVYFDKGQQTYYYGWVDATIFDIKKLTPRDAVMNKWLVELDRKGLKVSKMTLEQCIFNEMYYTEINYLTDQLDTLQSQYDGADHLAQVVGSLTTHDNKRFATYFTKWAINLVAGIYQDSIYDVNEHAIILTGGQGLKKSGFFTGLMWDYDYCANVHNFNPDNNQHQLLMTTSPLILIDEMTGYSKADIGSLKSVMSKAKLSTDKKFENNEVYKRIASFCGTTNEHDFLKDATGDRRFLTFEVLKELNYQKFNVVDKKQLWGQVVAMYKAGESYKFSQAEIATTIESNMEFTIHSHEDTFLETMLEITGNRIDVVTANQLKKLEADYKTLYKPAYFVSGTVKNKLKQQGVMEIRVYIGTVRTRVMVGVKIKDQNTTSTPVSVNVHMPLQRRANGPF